jgi:DNA-3-methyladenine glycosylase II
MASTTTGASLRQAETGSIDAFLWWKNAPAWFGLNAAGTKHLSQVDPVMARLIARIGPVGLKARRLPPFQSLVQAIIYQQLSGKAAETILGRFQALFGNGHFPTPEEVLALGLEGICAAGLSKPKANYIRGLSEKALVGHLPTLSACEQLSDAEIVAQFTEIKGIGRWTAEMFLMFNLGRPDVLPVHDLGVRKGFQIAYGKRKLPEPEALDRFGKKWKPYRTAAAWYLWRVLDSL